MKTVHPLKNMSIFSTGTQQSISDSFCQEPPSIHNASVLIEGFQTGNLALYSCAEGYVATGGLSTITCNGTHWSQTNFSCLGWFG